MTSRTRKRTADTVTQAQSTESTISITQSTSDPKNNSQDSFAHLNDFGSKSPYADSGNYPHIHYKTKIHPFRFKVRQWLLPYVRAETPILAALQTKIRSPYLDFYFAYSANLAAHTFYVIMLPLPIWFGYSIVTRDLVSILGYGIFFSGFIKDFCCLPRPRSPPLHRITMSGYTAKEYGFPSSHAANATGVTLYLAVIIWNNTDAFSSNWTLAAVSIGLFIYYTSLIFGRLYCGMHGFSDLAVGSIIGLACYCGRMFTAELWDSLVLKGPLWIVLLSFVANYALVYVHPEPVDDCPCYDDSVAFIGVIMGLELAQWMYSLSYLNVEEQGYTSIEIPYSYAELGFLKSILRVVLGVGIVVVWKEISKPLLFKIIKPFYSMIFSDNSENPTTFNRIRSDTFDKKERLIDAKGLVRQLGNREKSDSVGPQSSIDERELEEIRENAEYFIELDKLQKENVAFTCGVFKKRYDLAIIVRLIVYGGVAFCSAMVFPLAAQLCGLAAHPH